MRIAFVAEYPATPERVIGGVQAVVRRLAGAMARRDDLEVHVVSCQLDVKRAHTEVLEGIQVHRLPAPRHFGNVTLGWGERNATARALRELSPDVAHAHVLGPPTLGTAAAGVPWVATAHGIQGAYRRRLAGGLNRVRGWSYAKMEQMSLKVVERLIVISPYVLEYFGERLRGIRVDRIENPVDDSFFAIQDPGDPGTILYSGRLVPLKDPQTLLAAAAILAAEGRDFELRLAGLADDPAYAAQLERHAAEKGIGERVIFLGSLSPLELAAEMTRAGIFVLPSRQETASVAIMEAMAAGRPVVATDVGGNRYLVEDGVSGRLVPVGKPGALATALAELLADPQAARRQGAAGRRVAADRFRTESVVERTLEVYRDVAVGGGRARALGCTGWDSRNHL
jgi:glycosyltransferase involved in cell wall biosynthesis